MLGRHTSLLQLQLRKLEADIFASDSNMTLSSPELPHTMPMKKAQLHSCCRTRLRLQIHVCIASSLHFAATSFFASSLFCLELENRGDHRQRYKDGIISVNVFVHCHNQRICPLS